MFSMTDFGQSPLVNQSPAPRMTLTEIHARDRAEFTVANESGEGLGVKGGLQDRSVSVG
jgi:hypothetical protein